MNRKKVRLDEYERKVEDEILHYRPVSQAKRAEIERSLDQANEKKSISLRLRKYDLEKLKERAEQEGIPYQTLLSVIIHKFVTDQLIDRRSLIKGLQLLKNGNIA
ncbi:MAG: antitoxin [Deltaproteobacteria bacterium]|nr:antitoxin [Deltaproteobacteria bacterium]